MSPDPQPRDLFALPMDISSVMFNSVSGRQFIVGSCSFIHSDSLCLLIGVFGLFIFKVIIGIVGFISVIFLLPVGYALPLFFLFYSFSVFSGFNYVILISPFA